MQAKTLDHWNNMCSKGLDVELSNQFRRRWFPVDWSRIMHQVELWVVEAENITGDIIALFRTTDA